MSIFRSPRGGRVSTRLVLVLVGVPVLLVALVGLFIMRGGGPELAVRQFMLAEAQNDIPTLLTLIPAADAARVRAQLHGQMPPPVKNAQVPEVEIGKAEVHGNNATVQVTEKGPAIPGLTYGPLEQKESIALVKEGGQWKVDLTATEAANQTAPGGQMGGAGGGMEQAPPPGVEAVPAPEAAPSAGSAPGEQPPAPATPAGKHKSRAH
jgi:hypothetical protein